MNTADKGDELNRTNTHVSSEEAVIEATGHGWQDRSGLLDEWGTQSRSHTEVVRWLTAEHGVGSWWAQSIAVSYERALGLRAPGQRADGFSISASKTLGVPVERLFEALENEALRERWLPGTELRLRTATPPRPARYDWEDGSTRLAVGFTKLADAKSSVALAHERLPDADAAEEMRAASQRYRHHRTGQDE